MAIQPVSGAKVPAWSANASRLDLPESMRLSVADTLCDSKSDNHNNKFMDSELTINHAWALTSKYALRKVRNKSRDSDRLAHMAAESARLNVPGLEFLMKFPFSQLSDNQTQRHFLRLFRDSSERVLENVYRLSLVPSGVSEEQLVKIHDSDCMRELRTISNSLDELDEAISKPMFKKLSLYLKDSKLPSNLQFKSSQREEVWNSVHEKAID